MYNSVDFKLLEFAVSGKYFIAELATQTRENYYSAETRIAAKVLIDYFQLYKGIPSYEQLCEFAQAERYPNLEQTKSVLKQVYSFNKDKLIDGDFNRLIKLLKDQYNDYYLKDRIKYVSQTLTGQYDLDGVNDCVKKMALEISTIKATQIHDQGTLQESAIQRLNRYKEIKENPELARGIPSGFRDLDKITNGFRGSELILVSGPTGSGKSTCIMNMAVNAWLGDNKYTMSEAEWNNSGHNVWFITIENPKEMLERRIDACLAGISCDHIRDGKLTTDEEAAFRQSLRFQHEYGNNQKFHISDLGRGVSMAMVEAEYEKILSRFKPEIIIIDYLGIMKAISPTGSDWLDQGAVAAEMHEFCRAIKDTPIISASQMKSGMRTQNGIKRFTGDPESVARSKMITDNVNMNIQIKKDEDFNISSYVELCIAKNRDGKTGDVITLIKEFWRQRMCDPDVNFLVPPNVAEDNYE